MMIEMISLILKLDKTRITRRGRICPYALCIFYVYGFMPTISSLPFIIKKGSDVVVRSIAINSHTSPSAFQTRHLPPPAVLLQLSVHTSGVNDRAWLQEILASIRLLHALSYIPNRSDFFLSAKQTLWQNHHPCQTRARKMQPKRRPTH